MTAPFYIPIGNTWEIQFLHVLASIWSQFIGIDILPVWVNLENLLPFTSLCPPLSKSVLKVSSLYIENYIRQYYNFCFKWQIKLRKLQKRRKVYCFYTYFYSTILSFWFSKIPAFFTFCLLKELYLFFSICLLTTILVVLHRKMSWFILHSWRVIFVRYRILGWQFQCFCTWKVSYHFLGFWWEMCCNFNNVSLIDKILFLFCCFKGFFVFIF